MCSIGFPLTPSLIENLCGILVYHPIPYQVGMILKGFLLEHSEKEKQQHIFIMNWEPLGWIKNKM
jgi:hypothetical protein